MIETTDRTTSGRFKPGSKGGPGNPHASQVQKFRKAMMEALTPQDVEEVVYALLAEAKSGNVAACKELLDRLVGKAEVGADIQEQLDLLEKVLAGVTRGRN